MKNQPNQQLVFFKTCNTCKKPKNPSDFNVQKKSLDGLQNVCRECISLIRKEKWKNDPQHREKLTKKVLDWYEANKIHVLKRTSAYSKEYFKNPCARIVGNLRKRLEGKTKLKSKIGLNITDLKIYLETLFVEGMTWENYGKDWFIGLIIPIDNFDLNDPIEVSKINYYTNLKVHFSPKVLKSKGLLNPKDWVFTKK